MKSRENTEIPTHSLESGREQVVVRGIDHRNHYDFTQVHRHTYFELMFFVVGGGRNLIDFVDHEVRAQSCYIIFPHQIHLLNRAPGSHGQVVQFAPAAILSPRLQTLLQERAWAGAGGLLFQDDADALQRALQYVDLMRGLAQGGSPHRQEALLHLLQALLLEVSGPRASAPHQPALAPDFHQFLLLIDRHYRQEKTVAFYLAQLHITEKRLAQLAQKHRGLSPLQLIHQRILLEAKRLLSTAAHPHKEIAYELGFDSPASFSAFIKKKTGHTPSELQAQMEEIHKQ